MNDAPDEDDTELREAELPRGSKILIGLGQALVLTLIATNIYSIHKFKWTLTSWTSLLILPVCLGGLALVVLVVLLFVSGKEEPAQVEGSTWELLIKVPLGVALGTLLAVGCLPFWVNTWRTSETVPLEAMLTGTSDAIVTHEDGTAMGKDTRVGTDVHFEYKGHEFTLFQPDGAAQPRLRGEVRKGWLGWEFILSE